MTLVGWVTRLFDSRDTLVRMVLLDLSGVSYLVFAGPGHEPTTLQWILAVAAFAATLVLHRRPVVSLVAQVVLLVVSFLVLEDPTISQVGTGWLLLEVAMWAGRPRTIWLCTVLVTAAYAVDSVGDPWSRVRAAILGDLALIAVPLLIGLVIRTTRELGAQARSRLESESRAARADERTMIARELHDVVAHHVASMVLRVGVARHVLPGADPRVTEVFDDVHATGSAALADLRRLVAVLRNPDSVRGDAALTAIEPAALPAALSAAVANAERAGVTVDAEVDPSVRVLDAARGLALLRLTQEALTNVAKHAHATRATVTAQVADARLLVEIRDDGVGGARLEGAGLGGLADRLVALDGTLRVESPSDAGTLVAAEIPLAERRVALLGD